MVMVPYRTEIKHTPMLWSAIVDGERKTPIILEIDVPPLQVECKYGIMHINQTEFLSMVGKVQEKILFDSNYFQKIEEKRKLAYANYEKTTKVLKQLDKYKSNAILAWKRANDDIIPIVNFTGFADSFYAKELSKIINKVVNRKPIPLFNKERLSEVYLISSLFDENLSESFIFQQNLDELERSIRNNQKTYQLFSLNSTSEILKILDQFPDLKEKISEFIKNFGYVGSRDFIEPDFSDKGKLIDVIKIGLDTESEKPKTIDYKHYLDLLLADLEEYECRTEYFKIFNNARKIAMEKERCLHLWLRGKCQIKRLLLKYGQQLKEMELIDDINDIFFLEINELENPSTLQEIIARRKKEYNMYSDYVLNVKKDELIL